MRTFLMLTLLFNSHLPDLKEDFRIIFLIGFEALTLRILPAGLAVSFPDLPQEDDHRNDQAWDRLNARFETSEVSYPAYPSCMM
jgi:hypothetical protein